MIYRISHQTHYSYSDPVTLCHNIAHLFPRNTRYQRSIRTQINCDPNPTGYREHTDHFGNRLCFFDIARSHRDMTVVSVSDVQINAELNELDFSAGLVWEQALQNIQREVREQRPELLEFTLPSPAIPLFPALRRYAHRFFTPGRPVMETLHALNCGIHDDFAYDQEATDVATPLARVMVKRHGVCQDFAHVAVGTLRSIGFPVAYVSGYLETLPPPGRPRLLGADASHAWFSVWLPELGWTGFDPTNRIRTGTSHIELAIGRDYSDLAPIRGVVQGGGTQEIEVAVDVTRQQQQEHGEASL